MAARLEITWDGAAPGLADRRLSLDAFGPALRELLAAVRRIASDLELRARGPQRSGARGRLAREAANLDVQIETITANSPIHLACAVLPVEPPTRPLIDDLADQALDLFLTDVEREARGAPAHYRVRKFLAALPNGVSEQKYRFRSSDGRVNREVTVGAMRIAEVKAAPHLVEFDGVLVGLGFEEGRAEAKIRASTGELVSVSATNEQAENALPLRLQQVTVLAVAETSRTRLLRLATNATTPLQPRDRSDRIFADWYDLLARLAQ